MSYDLPEWAKAKQTSKPDPELKRLIEETRRKLYEKSMSLGRACDVPEPKIETPSDNEARPQWFRYGDECQAEFLKQYGFKLGLRANPARATAPTAIDLVRMADVKTTTEPWRIFPGCVSFNAKDMLYYAMTYGNPAIYFWVKWDAPLKGVWMASLVDLAKHRASFELHWYKERGRMLEQRPETRVFLQRMEPERLKADESNYYAVHDASGNAMCSYIVPLAAPLVQVI